MMQKGPLLPSEHGQPKKNRRPTRYSAGNRARTLVEMVARKKQRKKGASESADRGAVEPALLGTGEGGLAWEAGKVNARSLVRAARRLRLREGWGR